MKPGTKVGLALAGFLVFSVVGFYAVENLRGKAVLEETFARVSSDPGPKGFRAHDEFIPPDEENFYRAPILACLSEFRMDPDVTKDLWDRIQFDRPHDVEKLNSINLPFSQGMRNEYYCGGFLNTGDIANEGIKKELIVWADAFRNSSEYSVDDPTLSPSRQVLEAIDSRFGHELAALAKAAQNPYSYCPSLTLDENEASYEEPSLAFVFLRPMLNILSFRLLASLDSGDSDVFRETWVVYRKIIEGGMRGLNQTDLFSGAGYFDLLIEYAAIGIKAGQLSREDLLMVHRDLREFRFREVVEGSFAEEIIFNKTTFDAFKKRRVQTWERMRGGRPVGILEYLVQVAPEGWIDLNAASSMRWTYEEGVLPWRTLDFKSLRDFDTRLPDFDSLETILAAGTWCPDKRFATDLARIHVKKELTQLACLLEVFNIDHGGYPEKLSELIPEYLNELPMDPFSGEMMKYFPDGNRYKLYSVGMNLTDDFGYVVRNENGYNPPEGGDWVWGEGKQISLDEDLRREKAVFRIQSEAKRGEKFSDETFSEVWGRHVDEPSKPGNPAVEKFRRQRVIQKAREKFKQDSTRPRP